jgi:hypothetical protein
MTANPNQDLPSSWKIPGVYISINLAGSGAGLNSFAKRLLLVGYRSRRASRAVGDLARRDDERLQ